MKNTLSHHPLKQFQLSFERGILDVGIKPGGGFHYCLPVTEDFKTVFSMVFAQTAVTTAAKREVMIGKMPAGIIHTGAA